MKNHKHTAPLDRFSEYAMAAESDHYPKTDFSQFGFQGKIDYCALCEAYSEALADIPIFSSHLSERRNGFFYEPYWTYNHEIPNTLQVVDCRHMVQHPFDPMQFSTEYYKLRTRRRFDLSREFPFNCSLLRVDDDKYIFSILYHHSALDPNKAYRVLTGMLQRYHEKVTGTPPEWVGSLGMAALKRSTALVKPIAPLTFMRDQLVDVWVKNRNGVVQTIASEELLDYRKVKGRYSFRAVIDDRKLLDSLMARVKRNEATLNDLVFAVARKTLTAWNEERNIAAERFRFMLVTSLKGRMELPPNAGAGLAGLNFVSAGHQNADLDTLIRFYRDNRRNQLARGIDIQFYNTLCKIVGAMRMFPMEVRHRLMDPLAASIPCTFYVSNLGVVWPRWENGRPTMDSAIIRVGDFEINDVHSSASMGRSIGLGLTIRTHNRRLFLNFVADRFRFRRLEVQELVNRIVADLINAA